MPKTADYFKARPSSLHRSRHGADIRARRRQRRLCRHQRTRLSETAEMIDAQDAGSNSTGRSLALTIDVTKRAAVNDMIELWLNEFGRVHFLFNSAVRLLLHDGRLGAGAADLDERPQPLSSPGERAGRRLGLTPRSLSIVMPSFMPSTYRLPSLRDYTSSSRHSRRAN